MTVIDVRTPEEYAGGHIPGSFNLPLQEILQHSEEIQSMPRPVYLCCASGNRSGLALQMLQASGITGIYNGGSWNSLQNLIKTSL